MAVNQDTPSSTSGTSTENVTNLVDGTTTIMTTNLVDGGHPYFLNSSDSPGMNLINVSFDDESSPLFEQWRRCNDMVIDWLLNSLSKDIVESVIYSQTIEELWSELEKRYEQADGAKLFQLQRELNNISQGTNDVAAYFTRINRIWDQMKVLNTFMTCCCEYKCGAKTHNYKMNKDQKLIQFLMGLNEGYSSARGNILMMKPLTTTSQAYSIILHEESQREVHSGNQVITVSTESSVFNVNTHKWNAQKSNNEYRGGNQNINNEARKNNIFCSYCKKPDTINKNDTNFLGTHSLSSSLNQRETMEIHKQMQHLLRKVKDQRVQPFLEVWGSNGLGSDANASANFVGKCFAFHTFISCFTSLSSSKFWITDSGASQHMTHNRTLLKNFKELTVLIQVKLPNSYKVKVTSLGSVSLSLDLELHNVLYIPSFRHNLLFVNQLCKQPNCDVILNKVACLVHAPSLKRQMLLGEVFTGLYMLEDLLTQSRSGLNLFRS
uniref:Retrovirus-related Pol polyprotein from transposon TNT 1-94-like beta-barrel domain-containing protein n=1 Tax=Nicotiana tabacum TaxID=4097 RepID=A0A1S4BA50_TOBAC|nr:PREDICTED: uncharacterized protein LOC107806180 [Nicotiana tabacum]